MKTLVAVAMLLAMLVPGVAFAGASTDAALGLGAFAVFNQIISGTGIFGAFHPAPGPVVVAPPVQERVVVREYHPVYVQPPVYYAHPPVHYYVRQATPRGATTATAGTGGRTHYMGALTGPHVVKSRGSAA